MKYIFSIIIVFSLLATTANAQFFQTGQDPSHIKWRQINTLNFQIIYPEGFENEAKRMSTILTKVYDAGSNSMDHTPKKVSVILHSHTTNSNGLVAWAPKRIELFTTPHQQIYPQDWLEQLAIHEYRHLIQLDKIQSELPFLLKFILGEQATAAITGLYLPLWFLEGDAVVNETALSLTGRGRLASFSIQYRAQLEEKGIYSFDKAYLGSFKDFVPDYYQLGYWMVARTREKYGQKVWSQVIQHVGQKPLSVTPFNSELKRLTGLSTKQLYWEVFNDLKNEWKQESHTPKTNQTIVSPNKNTYTQYRYPEFYQDSLIIAYRTSLDDIGRFVLVHPDKSEEMIYTPGYIFEESISVKDQLIIWAERQPDIRWTHAERSVICLFNMIEKTKHRWRFDNNLFSPVISPDHKSFACIEADAENNYFLSVFDLLTGQLKHRFQTADNHYLFTPCWDEKGEKLYLVCLSSKGKYLASYDLVSRKFQQITAATYANIKNPVYTNNQLLFIGDFSGKDNLYSLNTESGSIYPIFSSLFGVDDPSAINSKGEILLSNYNSNGYQLSIVSLKANVPGQPIKDISLKPNRLADILSAQEKGILSFEKNDTINIQSSKYSKGRHLFNFHSWAPAFIDVDNYDIRPGVSLFSQNMLGTAETLIGYDYDPTSKLGKYKLGFNYYGWWPEFKTTLSYGNGTSNYLPINDSLNRFDQVIDNNTTINNYRWSELNADFNIRLPLNLSRGKYFGALIPEIQYNFSHLKPSQSAPSEINSRYYHAISYRLYQYFLLHQSTRSLIPRWGYQLDFIYRHTPVGDYQRGTVKGLQSYLYFPGFLKNNGIRLYQGYQQKTFNTAYGFANFVRSPRGINYYENNKMYSLSVDYRMPLLYPDLSMGKLMYIKRIKSSLFYDYAWLLAPDFKTYHGFGANKHQFQLNSMGLELMADLHVFRFFAPFEFGVRTIYLPQLNAVNFDLLFSVDFNGF